ncbi:MAG: hypothetical protein OEM91_06240 [Hyphomicrobiales bacterium]|nr:hypothetical protein [Hyphomicrobiales bacterium]
MDTFIAVVFDNEAQAYKGAEALDDLHRNGDLVIYSTAVIGKDDDGNVSIKRAADEGPIGTAFGMLTGALVGVLAGPAAVAGGAVAAGTAAASVAATGMAAGTMTGGLFGMYRDLFEAGLDADVLEKVSIEILPGKSALVAAIDEVWTTPLDTKMQEAGGIIFRQARIEVIDDQLERDAAAYDAELRALQEEWDEADEAAKAAIKEKIDAAKKRMSEGADKAMTRMEELQDEFEARQSALDQQIVNAAEQTKAKFEKRKAELQVEYKARSEKLKQAAKLAGSALT